MSKDIDKELDEIFNARQANIERAKKLADEKKSALAEFEKAWSECLNNVVSPALREMAAALGNRGVRASAGVFERGIAIYIADPERVGFSRESNGGRYVGITPNADTRTVHFERNTSGGGRGSGIGDYAIQDITAEVVKAKVMTLVRELFGT